MAGRRACEYPEAVPPPPLPPGRPVPFASGPVAGGLGARARAWAKAHPRTTIAGRAALGVLLLYMLAGGPLAASLIAGRASEKLGRPVTIGGGHGGLGAIVLGDIAVAR